MEGHRISEAEVILSDLKKWPWNDLVVLYVDLDVKVFKDNDRENAYYINQSNKRFFLNIVLNEKKGKFVITSQKVKLRTITLTKILKSQ